MEYFATNQNSYFEHHGILGQKWGKKNGPPYPLDYSKLSAEERAKDKQRAIDEGDVESVAYKKNKNYFTNQEINDVINRYQLNARISQLNAESQKAKAGKSKVDQFLSTMDTVQNVGNKLANGIDAGTRVYNSVAKVMNAFGDAQLPIVGQSKEQKKVGSVINNIDKISGTITKTVNDGYGNTTITKDYINGKKPNQNTETKKETPKKEETKETKEKSGVENVSGDVVDSGNNWKDYNKYQKQQKKQQKKQPNYSVNTQYFLEDKKRRY